MTTETQTDLQSRLKTETSDLHKKAENHPIMHSFVIGKFSTQDLLKFLINVLPLYQVVEQRLLKDDINSNAELKRSVLVQKDIDSLISLHGDGFYGSISEVTKQWLAHSWYKKTSLLKADLYVRWLADFYGGRILAKSQAPYNQMYTVENPSKAIGDVRNILTRNNDWDEPTDDEIIKEAKDVFQFHIDLFNDF
jgi:heme oxygenase